ncbi:MAG: hypothetical protein IPI64_07090 [Chloracidobacterium sp.]|nr:hypothetical protein [Chloracidobacterium sp.]
MKFQKGILSDNKPVAPASQPQSTQSPAATAVVEKDRLFQTVKEETGSERNYLKVLGIVVGLVVIVGGIVFYLTLPGVGDQVRGSTQMEMAVRDHFLTKEKRTATDITFYQCDKYFWARVGVEVRTDIKTNPIYALDKYAARIEPSGSAFNIIATPVTSPEIDVPCK